MAIKTVYFWPGLISSIIDLTPSKLDWFLFYSFQFWRFYFCAKYKTSRLELAQTHFLKETFFRNVLQSKISFFPNKIVSKPKVDQSKVGLVNGYGRDEWRSSLKKATTLTIWVFVLVRFRFDRWSVHTHTHTQYKSNVCCPNELMVRKKRCWDFLPCDHKLQKFRVTNVHFGRMLRTGEVWKATFAKEFFFVTEKV